jgi:hypothetical protein
MRLLVAALVAALSVAGCASDGSEAEVTTTTTESATDSSSTIRTSTTATTTEPPSPLMNLQLGHDHLGPLTIGMTVEEAEQAIGEDVIEVEAFASGCGSYRPISTTAIDFVVLDGRITIIRTIGVSTDRGVGVGATEAAINNAYSDETVDAYNNRFSIRQVVVRPSPGSDHATIFLLEPGGSTVEQVKAGSYPEVERYDEGCA